MADRSPFVRGPRNAQPLVCAGARGPVVIRPDQLERDADGMWILSVHGHEGERGERGTDGTKWLVGEGAPSDDLGADGDFYLDSATVCWFGPKSAGSWEGTGPHPLLGTSGPRGEKGDTGDKGDTGLQGMQGDPGPQGVKGDTGAKGDKGDTGAQGVQGVQGVKGDTGAQGIQGVKGDTGAQGIQGVKGDTGAQGIQGVKGDTGAQGIQGVKGDKGDTGAQPTGTTPGAIPFVGPAPGLAWTEDGAKLFFDNTTDKLGIGHNAPTRDVHVKYGSAAGDVWLVPAVSVENSQIGVFGASYSFATFEMTANNRAVIGQFFADGTGALNPSITGTTGTPNLYFRTFTAHPIMFGTNGTRRMHIGATGNLTLGLREGDSFFQVGIKAANELYNVPARMKVHGAVTQSMVEEVMCRWIRNEASVQFWPGSADWKLSSVGPGGAPDYGKITKLVLALKNTASFNEGANVDVLDLRANGEVRIPALTATRVVFAGTGGLISDDADLTWDTATNTLTPKNMTLGEYDWDDVTLPASRISAAPGSNPPAYDATERCHKFAQGLDRDVDLSFEIQHSYVEGTSVYLHIHGFNSTNGAGNVRVIVKWRVLTAGIAPPAFTTDAAFTYASGSSLNVYLTDLKTVSDATSKINSVFQFNVQFARNNVADTYGGDVYVATYGIHYQKNTVGSQTVSSK